MRRCSQAKGRSSAKYALDFKDAPITQQRFFIAIAFCRTPDRSGVQPVAIALATRCDLDRKIGYVQHHGLRAGPGDRCAGSFSAIQQSGRDEHRQRFVDRHARAAVFLRQFRFERDPIARTQLS
jgi:hypothetical protein